MYHFLSAAGLLLLALFSSPFSVSAQATDGQEEAVCIAFYNLENIFDTINDPEKRDDDFTPTGSYNYTGEIYWDKQSRLARVISEIGVAEQKALGHKIPMGPSVLGVAEVENRAVLEDLVKQEAIAYRHYDIVHYESPDKRGIDVGLLYNPSHFEVLESRAIELHDLLNKEGKRVYTRDMLYVKGLLFGEETHFLVAHWPSRRGGEERSSPLREFAARRAREVIDSVLKQDANAKVLLMGDLNDDPTNKSLTVEIRAQKDHKKLQEGDMLNVFYKHYIKGLGSMAYRDVWSLFDQIVLSQSWLDKNKGWYFPTAKGKWGIYKWGRIYKANYMIQSDGQYKGYPKRAYSWSIYNYGYSDHFPTYIFVFRKK